MRQAKASSREWRFIDMEHAPFSGSRMQERLDEGWRFFLPLGG